MDATGTPDPINMTPKTCGEPSKDDQCSSAASFYPVPLPLGLLPPLVARSALGGRHPTGAKTPPAPFPPISALPPPHFPAVVFLPGTALLLPISMPSPLARSEGAAGASGAPGAQGQAPGGHCPIEPARGGSGGLCSPHEKPIQVFLLPCTSRRGNAKPTGMKGTFCGAAHPAGRGTRAGVRLAKGRHPHLAPSAWVSPLGDAVFLGQSLGAPFRVCSLLTPCFRVSQHCPSSLLLIFELIF